MEKREKKFPDGTDVSGSGREFSAESGSFILQEKIILL